MRLKRIFLSAALLMVSHTALAKRPYGMAGCGLGNVLLGGDGGQISAATTNGSTYNQAFGISSGTSNCKTDAQLAILMKQEQYLVANMATLQKEMARGEGETVVGLLEVLGCSKQAVPQGTSKLLNSYDRIFKEPGVYGVLEAAKSELRGDAELSQACQNLS